MGATTRSVQRWIATGRLPARRVGGRWRVAIDAIDAFALTGASRRDPIRTLFVANRGEIAARIARTCAALGVRAILPPTDGANAVDLLDAAAVVDAALAAGSDALHPGFGFLAENADFAAAVAAAGIRWIGPPPDAIRAMGDKAAARRLAAERGVPVVPGYDGDDQSDDALTDAAGAIGFPLLVKPAAGGGGKGMHVVRDATALGDALGRARREARAAFGDDRLVLERYVEGPRHVEIQVLFDAEGHGVHLGERDCSLQRRHQKVLEEAPSPAVDDALRARMGNAALRLAGAVGYVSAGTCEFLLEDDGSFWFLEMNTRLQVEHPVTEAVTGRDLVADQIRVAEGATLDELGLRTAATPRGHAVEVRLYAEDAEAGFLPATGRVEALRWPSGDGIRVDAGIEPGTEVGGRFDPMLAKVIAHGRDRAEALRRLGAALDETVVLGLVTNLRFLRWLVREPTVLAGEARIDTLGAIWSGDVSAPPAVPDDAWATAAAALLPAAGDPWAGGWRLNAAPTVRLATDAAERAVRVDDAPASARDHVRSAAVVHVDVEGRSVAFRIAPPPDVDRAAAAAASARAGGGAADLVAPMPGAVVAVHAAVGHTVAIGEPVVTLEAMKMEHVVPAPSAGRVASLEVAVGVQVERGQVLGRLEPGDGGGSVASPPPTR
jgi:acetyl-CoA/propionyl-CoA carboxylase, biotin carboxylase, biotin carboxyl carrier protein